MTALLERVRRFISEHGLVGRDTRVLVALSGGSDSVALAHIVRELDRAGELRAAGLAHFNHQLRPAADEDERFAVRMAAAFAWPISVDREDVSARARRERRSIEHAARTARHEFLERARRAQGADVVALGHTRDDQAETYLLRLLRGAGPRGLAAMHPRNGSIVRPLLNCRREELREYLAVRHADYVEDESNADLSIPRNRIRAELLPRLQAGYNPKIVDVLAKEAELAREVWDWLATQADEVLARILRTDPPGPAGSRDGQETSGSKVRRSRLDIPALMAEPAAVRRFVLWRAMTDAAGGRPVSFDHVRVVLRLLASGKAGSVDAPGQHLERSGSELVLTSRPEGAFGRWLPSREARPPVNFFDYPLSIPGEVSLPLAGCALSAETPVGNAMDLRVMSLEPAVGLVRRDLCGPELRVRNRRPGDRFRPLGLDGRKKLQDFLVDRKVARGERDTLPLVVDEHDRIVWVAGHSIDEAFRVTDPAQAVVVLRLKLLGGPA